MYIVVRLLRGLTKVLTYQVPASWSQEENLLYALVVVPLQKREVLALVVDVWESVPATSYSIREAIAVKRFSLDEQFRRFIDTVGAYYHMSSYELYRHISQHLFRFDRSLSQVENVELDEILPLSSKIILTRAQEEAVGQVSNIMSREVPWKPFLLHGVTGSGKTEVYKRLMEQCLAKKQSVLFMLPQTTLALEFERLLKKHFEKTYPVVSYHSLSTLKEKTKALETLFSGDPCILIGVHMPIFFPFSHLGLIIIDEEHDAAYQEKRLPHINAREVALIRAQVCTIPILLGSATPSLSSSYQVMQGKWQGVFLSERFNNYALPEVKKVFLSKDKKRPFFWFSHELMQALEDRLEKKEQSLLFINRRGYSRFVQCTSCGEVCNCPACAVSYTVHKNEQGSFLLCHYCGARASYPCRCSACKGTSFFDKGVGTQQIVQQVHSLFPQARVERFDLDVTMHKKKVALLLARIMQGEVDIIVGTQSISKGYHFPGVTLVGVIWADGCLHFPFYNAAESGLQHLIQVAGRAGRAGSRGEVIIQSIIDHPVLDYVDEIKYRDFCAHEIEKRKLLNYPPFMRFVTLELRAESEEVVATDAQTLATHVQDRLGTDFYVLGPLKPYCGKVGDMYVQRIYIKGNSFGSMQNAIGAGVKILKLESSVYWTPQPLQD